MPWPKDHKQKVRQKIVAAAANALRSGGVGGLIVEDVMAQAGLTHGAFYAHFDSKDDLVRTAIEHANEETLERFAKDVAPLSAKQRFKAAVAGYLEPKHVAHPEFGCPVAVLGPEISRAGGKAQKSMSRGLRDRIDWMRELLPKSVRGSHADDLVLGTFACMVGAVVIARVLGGKESDHVLESVHRFLDRALDDIE